MARTREQEGYKSETRGVEPLLESTKKKQSNDHGRGGWKHLGCNGHVTGVEREWSRKNRLPVANQTLKGGQPEPDRETPKGVGRDFLEPGLLKSGEAVRGEQRTTGVSR